MGPEGLLDLLALSVQEHHLCPHSRARLLDLDHLCLLLGLADQRDQALLGCRPFQEDLARLDHLCLLLGLARLDHLCLPYPLEDLG